MRCFYRKLLGIIVAVALFLTTFIAMPVLAGDPDKTVGGIDVNRYVCAGPDHKIVSTDSDAFTSNGDGTSGFDPDKEIDLDELKEECKLAEEALDKDLTVELVRQSKIEGYVYEFHIDPSATGGWRGVASNSVPVVASGPGFEIFWVSEKNGFFSFQNLGAGPMTFSLRLPPDAHPINPNVTVVTNGSNSITSGVYLAFYRGDMPPPDIAGILAPDGVPLPPANFTFDLTEEGGNNSLANLTGMPSVGGVLPPQQSFYTIGLAIVLLLILPLAGLIKLRRTR